MGAVKAENREMVATDVPRLKELLAPCPMCSGTTDIDLLGHVYCHSCRQEWTLLGEPLIEGDGAIWTRPVGIGIGSSPGIEGRPCAGGQPALSVVTEFPVDVYPNCTRGPVSGNPDLVGDARGNRLKELPGRFQFLSRLISDVGRKCFKKEHK